MAVKSKFYLDDMFWRPQTYCTVCQVVVQTLQLIRSTCGPCLDSSAALELCVCTHYLKLGQANAAGVLDAPTPEVPVNMVCYRTNAWMHYSQQTRGLNTYQAQYFPARTWHSYRVEFEVSSSCTGPSCDIAACVKAACSTHML